MDKDKLEVAIREAWSKATSANPDIWSSDDPSRGQCDVTALVVRKHLGGDLVMGQVFVGDQ